MDGPVYDAEWQPPKGAHLEYTIAYVDPTPSMSGPMTRRQGSWKTPEEAQNALEIVYKRHHPEAWIEVRLVTPWGKYNG